MYTTGADGMVCEVDPTTGNLLRNFKASAKPVSSMCVSPGRINSLSAQYIHVSLFYIHVSTSFNDIDLDL